VYNKIWLETAMQRGDDIIIWSEPFNITPKFYSDLKLYGDSFFQREINFIKANASKFGYNSNDITIGILKKK
jgi:hypothetical protein